MGFVLRPGMKLMRMLNVAGKFGLVSVLLLVPMLTGMVSSYREVTARIAFADREIHGLAYVQPLSELIIDLTRTQAMALQGAPASDSWMALSNELDDATARYGDELAVRGDWSRLHNMVKDTYAKNLTAEQRAEKARLAARQTYQLIKKVADSSNLVLDPALDSNYLASMLVNRLPRLVISAADAQSLRITDAKTATAVPGTKGTSTADRAGDTLALQVAARDFADAARQLSLDLTTAVTSSSWRGLREQVGTQVWSLSAAVTDYSSTLALAADGASAPAPTVNDTQTLSESATSLSTALAQATHELLNQRKDTLISERSRPLILTLTMMLLMFYMLMSLFRATATDVRSVLEDISTVTTGGVHQTNALSGADEFAQMSRAVVYARDHLTALVGALKYQATHDDLTALANRTLFTDKVNEVLTSTEHVPIAVLLVDLDGFKDLNDSFGHDFGDRLLRMVAARIHRNVPRRSVVARLGSDEFAVMITDPRYTQDPNEVVVKLAEALAQPLDVDGRSIRIQAGIGYATALPAAALAAAQVLEADGSTEAPTDAHAAADRGDTPTPSTASGAIELIRNADVALSYAKQMGKGHQVRFEPRMHDHTRNRTELSADLVSALEHEELYVLYQPLVDLQTNHLYGLEALLRWNHPTRGAISPDVFIPLAEATGQITAIGKWVLEQSCIQLAAWRQDFPAAEHLTMEVNLATEQLTDPRLVSDVLAAVKSTGIDPSLLVLEITESALVKDLEIALRRMAQLSAIGVKIALDDFGTGYSSLSYLRRLPVTVMKIDKSFMRDDTAQGRALLRSIVDLGTGQGMQIVAEGIELPAQAMQMRRSGVHIGQGHLWAPALREEQIRTVLASGGRMGPPLTADGNIPRQGGVRIQPAQH